MGRRLTTQEVEERRALSPERRREIRQGLTQVCRSCERSLPAEAYSLSLHTENDMQERCIECLAKEREEGRGTKNSHRQMSTFLTDGDLEKISALLDVDKALVDRVALAIEIVWVARRG